MKTRRSSKNSVISVILLALVILFAAISSGCGGSSNSGPGSVGVNTGGLYMWNKVYPMATGFKWNPNKSLVANAWDSINFYGKTIENFYLAYASNSYFHSVRSRGSHSVAGGNNGELRVSHNNGNSWVLVSSGTSETIYDVKSTGNGKFMFFGGDLNPVAGRSVDNGDSFQTPAFVNAPPGLHFYCSDVDPNDENKIAIGGEGRHGFSSDNGQTITCYNSGTKFKGALYWGNGYIFYVESTTHTIWVYENDDVTDCKHTLTLDGISHAICKDGDDLYVAGFGTSGGKIWRVTIIDIENWEFDGQPVDLTSKVPGYTNSMGFWSLNTESPGTIKVSATFGKIFTIKKTGPNTTITEDSAETSSVTDVTSVDTSDATAPDLAATGDGTILKK